MNIRQMSVTDWIDVFHMRPMTLEQVDIIEERQRTGAPLATWERNCLKAYDRLRRQKAA